MSKKLIIKTPITNASEDYTLNLPNKNSGEYTIAVNEDVVHNTGDETNITGTKTLKGAAGESSTAISNTGISISGNINGNSSSLTDAGLSVNTGGGAPITVYARGQIQQVDGSGMHPTLTYTLPSDSGKLATENYVDDAIAALPEPMIFKGSVGSSGTIEWDNLPSPVAGNTGWTYKAITKHTTAPICEIGDTIISDGSTWWVIPSGDEPSGTVISVGTAAEANSGLTLTGGPITSSGTITVGLDSGYELLNSNTAQTIAGQKTFTSKLIAKGTYSNGGAVELTTFGNDFGGQINFKGDGHYGSNITLITEGYESGTDITTYTQYIQRKSGTIALKSDIPAVSLTTTAGSEVATVNSDSLNVVTRDTAQIISGVKTFATNTLKLTGDHGTITTISGGISGEQYAGLTSSGNVIAEGDLLTTSGTDFVKVSKSGKITWGQAGGSGTSYDLTFPTKSGTLAIINDVPTNLENGSGTKAIYQSYDTGYGNTIDMSAKNPNAWELYQAAGHSGNDKYITKGATGQYATSLGGISAAAGKRALADGTNTIAIGKYSHAEGDNSVTLGNESHAEGNQTVTNGSAAHSEGFSTQAIGNNAHAEGAQTIAYAENAHSEGYASTVKDNYIIVDHGITPQPIPPEPIPPTPPTPEELDALNGSGAHSEGHNTFVLGCGAHAEGDSTKAYGRLSHAEGRGTQTGELILRKTEDNKDYYTPNQDKQFQHAEGELTKAIGHASHAGGYETIAGYDYQTVVGKYNANKEHTLFEVGYGWADNERHNALEVWDDGRATVGANPTNNLDVATKEYVDNRIVDVSSLVKKIGDTMTGALTLNNGSAYATTSPSLIFSATDSAGWLYKDGNNLKFTHNAITSGSNYTLTFPTTTGVIATTDDVTSMYSYNTTTGVLTINLD